MRQLAIGLAAGLVAGLALGGGAATARAFGRAEGQFTGGYITGLEWKSNCHKPFWTSARGGDQTYATDQLRRFRECVASHAKADLDYASEIIVKGGERDIEEVKRDASAYGWTFY